MSAQAELQQELTRRESAKARVLAALEAAGPAGVLNTELNSICYRYGGRLHELRNEGYRIETQPKAAGLVRYVLLPKDRLF